jgi:hypothetical protein
MDRNLDIPREPIVKINIAKVNKSKQNDNWKLSETLEVSNGARKRKQVENRRSKHQHRE